MPERRRLLCEKLVRVCRADESALASIGLGELSLEDRLGTALALDQLRVGGPGTAAEPEQRYERNGLRIGHRPRLILGGAGARPGAGQAGRCSVVAGSEWSAP